MPKLKAKKKQRKYYKLPSDMPENKLGAVQNELSCQWQYNDLMWTNIFSKSLE
jgi:hypothetical protein